MAVLALLQSVIFFYFFCFFFFFSLEHCKLSDLLLSQVIYRFVNKQPAVFAAVIFRLYFVSQCKCDKRINVSLLITDLNTFVFFYFCFFFFFQVSGVCRSSSKFYLTLDIQAHFSKFHFLKLKFLSTTHFELLSTHFPMPCNRQTN